MRNITIASGLAALALPLAMAEPTLENVSSGLYELEKNHASLAFSVRHNGISDYTVNFTDFDASLFFDAQEPTNSTITVTINPIAVQTRHADADKKADWENKLATGDNLLNGDRFPSITFTSTDVAQSGQFAGKVTGDLTFRGFTKPLTLDVSYGGVANPPWFGGRDVIGFTASATLKRSDFGMDAYSSSVSDEVEIKFSGEFLQAE